LMSRARFCLMRSAIRRPKLEMKMLIRVN
jgi:hypothetical protein